MSATVVGTLVALALLVLIVLAAAEWALRHRRRQPDGSDRSTYPTEPSPTSDRAERRDTTAR